MAAAAAPAPRPPTALLAGLSLAEEQQQQHQYLPFEVVVAVLGHVEQQERLTVCARVCTTWAAAAVAASPRIQLSLAGIPAAARHARAQNLSAWLSNSKHQHTLRGLVLQGNDMSRPQLQLPLAALQQLEQLCLTNCRLTLQPSQQQHQQQQASALSSLQLQGCVLDWGRSSTSHHVQRQPLAPPTTTAASFTALQRLQLQQLLPGELGRQQQDRLLDAAPAAFQQMTQLTALVLKQVNQYESVLLAGLAAGLGGMQRLQELRLDTMQLTAAALQDLPSSITALELAGAKQLVLSCAALPRLTSLARLRVLSVEGVRRFEPRLLLHMPRLTALRVRSSSSRFLPDGPGGTQDLLAALRGLTLLQRLDMRNVLQHLLPAEDQQSLQAYYAGLTASSVLQDLDLSACRFPPHSAGLVLHAGCSLQHLQRLVLYRCEDPSGSVLQLQDLDHLVRCCPALQDVSLWVTSSSSSSSDPQAAAARQQQCQLAALQRLPGLTSLVVAGLGVSSAEVWALAQLRQLSSLAMYRCSQLTNAALLQLTQLQQLTVLAIDAHACRGQWHGFEQYVFLQGREAARERSSSSRAQAMPNLPVWQQLRNLLTAGYIYSNQQPPPESQQPDKPQLTD